MLTNIQRQVLAINARSDVPLARGGSLDTDSVIQYSSYVTGTPQHAHWTGWEAGEKKSALMLLGTSKKKLSAAAFIGHLFK